MNGIPRAHWEVLSPLLDQLLDTDSDQSLAFFSQIKRDDPALADQLARLLAHEPTMERRAFLSGEAFHVAAQMESATLAGSQVGSYTLDSPIGAGGMGTVWLAHRSDGRYAGKVAVKLLHLGLLTGTGAERFRREGDVLARLTHSNITRLLDAGVAKGGQPYLILEYVEGEPIDRWCRARCLDVPSRVRLFLDVLTAVSHAHSKLILHRDLKPSNILVTTSGQVKLLDFGVAKLLDDESGLTEQTGLTRSGGVAFTPGYAAPEQVRGGEMTTATDVYSLGVVLYELLAGTRPYQGKACGIASVLEEAIASHGAPLASNLAPEDIRRHLRGDLDAILARALKKRSSNRYLTVSAFSEDLKRFLDGRPVQAQPDRIGYRLAKFAVRNKLAVFASAAMLGAVLIGSSAALWQARVASMERDRTLVALDRNEAAIAFMYEMINMGTINNFSLAHEKEAIQQLLEEGERHVEASFRQQPELHATFLQYFASFHEAEGRYVRASAILEHAANLVRDSRDSSLRAEIECNHALATARSGRAAAAQQSIEEWLAREDLVPAVAARCQLRLVTVLTNSFDAPAALEHALAVRAWLQAGKRWLPLLEAESLGQLGWALYLNGRNSEAQAQYAAALKIYSDLGRSEIPAALATRDNWALAVRASGDTERARSIQEETQHLASRYRQHARVSPLAILEHAVTLAALEKSDAALRRVDEAVHIAEETGAAVEKILAQVAKVSFLAERGFNNSAEKLLAEASNAAASVPADVRVRTALGMARARLFLRRGRLAEASATLAPLVQMLEERRMRTPLVVNALCLQADILLELGDRKGAWHSARRGLEIARSFRSDRHGSPSCTTTQDGLPHGKG
jgi:serine/threonine protein kinase/tetratricopeptide (TPR) repeat protein